MKFLKGLALSLLGLLLFLSLSVFGLALTLNQTLLNPDFFVSEMDKLDVPSLAREVLSEQIAKGEFPEEFGTALVNTITKLEPLVKEQVGAATYSIFDYLLGKSQSLDLALVLGDTILNPDFIVSLVDELDISSLAGEFLSEQLTKGIPEEIEYLFESSLDDAIAELEPLLKGQISTAAEPILDYLLGKSQSFSVVISLEPMKESLKDTVREAILKSPPPELAGLPPAVIEQYFDEFYQQFSEEIPSTFVFNESLLGTETPAKIAEALAEAEGTLEQVREYVSYFQLGYNVLIGVILFLILCIILLAHGVRGSTRSLGSIFLSYGAFEYIGILVTKHFAGAQVAQLGLPPFLQGWLPQFLENFLAPLEMFSLGLLIGGIVLLIVSFVYKPREASY